MKSVSLHMRVEQLTYMNLIRTLILKKGKL